MAIISKIPPWNQEAEESLLCCLILNPDLLDVVCESLTKDDFYQERHRIIFEAMLTVAGRGSTIELVSLADHIKAKDQLAFIGGHSALAEFADKLPSAIHYREYMRIVREKAVLRRLLNIAMEVAEECYRDYEDIDALIDMVDARVFALYGDSARQHIFSVSELVMPALKQIESFKEQKVSGLSSGLADVDRYIGGFQNQDLIIIAARPSLGKSALVLSFLEHLSAMKKLPTCLFSLEMSREQLIFRLMCSLGRISYQKLRSGQLSETEFARLSGAAAKLEETPLHIDEKPGKNILSLCSTARKMKREHGVVLVAIDYLQLIQGTGKAENRVQEVSDISARLKGLARELDVPVIALSQLNRQAEYRADKKPTLADLRESGALEQDSDVVLMLYRDKYYNPDTGEGDKTEIIIAKNRNGPTGKATVIFRPEYMRFESMMQPEYYANGEERESV